MLTRGERGRVGIVSARILAEVDLEFDRRAGDWREKEMIDSAIGYAVETDPIAANREEGSPLGTIVLVGEQIRANIVHERHVTDHFAGAIGGNQKTPNVLGRHAAHLTFARKRLLAGHLENQQRKK